MDQLWAPWRLSYITQPVADKPAGSGCFICDCLSAPPERDRENLVFSRRDRCVVMLNRFPYNNGHLLVAPLVHKAGLEEMTDAEVLDCHRAMREMMGRLRHHMKPDGFNVGLNLGKVAGAGLPGHLHWHIVPRWAGDTNFMPVVSDTRVIVQSLDALYDLLLQNCAAG